MRCVICHSPEHTADNCDRFKRPEIKTRCPGCFGLVTASERELHQRDGCVKHMKARVNHDSSRTD